jgi:hypothetical protein
MNCDDCYEAREMGVKLNVVKGMKEGVAERNVFWFGNHDSLNSPRLEVTAQDRQRPQFENC